MAITWSKISLGIVLCLTPAAAATRGPSYKIEVYDQEKGLPSNEVNAIAQDGRGQLWLASRSGLFAFDGMLWETHHPQLPPASSYSFAVTDALGRVWAVNETRPYVVVSRQEGQWISLPPDSLLPPYSLSGLAVVLEETGPRIAMSSREDGLAYWDGAKWSLVQAAATGHIHGIVPLGGSFYLATSRGLLRLKQGKLEPISLGDPQIDQQEILAICPDRGQGLWIHGQGWLASWKEGGLNALLQTPQLSLEGTSDRRMAAGLDDWVYLATNEQLMQIQPQSGDILPLGRINGLNFEGARTLFVDRENSLWLANRTELVRVAGRRFANYDSRHGLLEDEVSAIAQPNPDEMILGHNAGLTFWKKGKTTQVRFPGISQGWKGITRVLDLRVDSQGRTWAASAWAGLACIDGETITWYGPESGLLLPVNSALEDRKGLLWVAADRELFHFDGERFIPHTPLGLRKGNVRRIFQDRQGVLYLATSNLGLLERRPEGWRTVPCDQDGKANSVYALLEDSRGRLWVGTGGGLYRSEKGRLVGADQVTGEDRPVYSLLEDRQHRLWIGTDNGVVVWDGSRSRHFAARDGLAGLETNRAAALLDHQGRVWIGTDRGLSLYQPQFDHFEAPLPDVEILSARAAGEDLPLSGEVSLDARQGVFQFGFRALSLKDPHSIRYRFRLEGFEDRWQRQDNPYQRQVRYAGLQAGRYQFEVQAGGPQGWGRSATGPWMVLRPPFYLSWWFVPAAAGALLTAGCLFIFYRSRAERHSRYRRLVEEAPEAIVLLDPEKNRFAAANCKARRLLRAEENRLLRLGWLDCSPSQQPGGLDSAHAGSQYIRRALDGAEPIFEWNLRDLEGREFPCEVRMTRFNSGRRRFVRGSIHDITDRKKLEQEAHRKTSQLRALMFIGHLAAKVESRDGFVQQALELMTECLQAPCCLFLWAGGQQQTIVVAAAGSRVGQLKAGRCQDAHLVELADRLASDPESGLAGPISWTRPGWPGGERLDSLAAIRIGDAESRFGILAVYGETGMYLARADREFIQNAGQIMGTAFERLQAEGRLRQSLKEKDVLLQEIHHRVKNNLQVISSLLSLQARRSGDGHAAADLNQSRNRVRTMALIHERLYRSHDLRNIDFQEYLTSLARNLVRSSSLFSHVEVLVDARGVFFDIDTAVPCGLIVNELVSNALQHGFGSEQTGTVEVKVRHQAGNAYWMTVSDNGGGLPEGFAIQENDSLGLVLVRALTQQLEGSIEILRPAVGSCFRIQFHSVAFSTPTDSEQGSRGLARPHSSSMASIARMGGLD